MKFAEEWFVDFEYYAPPGELPSPLCMVAYERNRKRLVRLSRGEFPRKPPYSAGRDALFVAFAADAELLCHYVLGWPFPENVIDLHVEYLNYSNYIERDDEIIESSLLSVLTEFHVGYITSAEKEAGRALAMQQGGPRTAEEWLRLVTYCEEDVKPLEKLYRKLVGPGNLQQAIERGRYMKSVAMTQAIATPIDVKRLEEFRAKWEPMKRLLVSEMDQNLHVFDGAKFDNARFINYLNRRGWLWPLTDVLKLPKTDKKTFKEKILTYPELAPLHELKSTLSLMKHESIAVGSDGRNRTALHAFRSKSSRNQPGSSKFIFGAPSWMRSFAKPADGMAIAYIDFCAEEFAIAGVLSGDKAMQRAYIDGNGDPYLSFAKLTQAIPPNATKESHHAMRDLFKTVALGIQYSMGAAGLAQRLNKPLAEAEALLAHHKTQFPNFWSWADRVVTHMEFHGWLSTASGWRVVRHNKNFPARWRRSTQNWLIQSTGADLLRRVCSLVTESGIRLCAPVHDAILIEDETDKIERTVADTRELMRQASRDLLGGFEIETEAKIFTERFYDKRGVAMWERVNRLMDECQGPPQMSLF
jgi:hypothetical protein